MEQLLFSSFQPDTSSAVLVSAAVLLGLWVVPFFIDKYDLQSCPGPLLAKFSNLWLTLKAYNCEVTTAIDAAHQRYGPIVRLSPKHVSIADPDALNVVYGHSSGTLKSDFYDTFVVFRTSMFTTRSRPEHARKRKYTAHAMSMKGIADFEPAVRGHQHKLVKQFDDMCAAGAQGKRGVLGSCSWTASGGLAWLDCVPWLNFETFDIIGDLAFGAPFGMLEAGRDTARVPKSEARAMKSYGRKDDGLEWSTAPAIQVIRGSGHANFVIGCLPPHFRPLVKKVRELMAGFTSPRFLGKIAIAAVAKRLSSELTRKDFLSHIVAARDEDGKPLSEQEVTSEAISLIVAGSETTASSLGAIVYYIARDQGVQAKLQQELDEALGAPELDANTDEVVAPFDAVKNLAYLQDVINEGLRLHSTLGFGLPREVPVGGLTVAGRTFPAGTHISCPMYTLHRLQSIWGDDADVFNPDRWARGDRKTMLSAFAPFSLGPRACIGRNLAMMEMTICVATVFHRYRVVLGSPDQQLDVHESFVRKPKSVLVGLQRRA
ncbi:cytochrome P450 [Phanerochaete sordida]|uniref:Cytochrome P450 n=1 Tax=Phanerochaete sordida TaxID=48140 RepID=A0A9P3LBX9_9APHY|nr:cytochrome P450 [Phanerochaete sordida]